MPERHWTHAVTSDDIAVRQAGSTTIAPAKLEQGAHFSTNLRECVATNDPKRLAEVERGEIYPIYGWFIDRTRTSAVIQCMRATGWRVVGPAL